MAAGFLGLKNIKQLPRARPDELRVHVIDHGYCFSHHRHGIAAGIGDAARKNRNIGRSLALQRRANLTHLLQREQSCDVDLNSIA
jgi:hypothetical protein